ncbi:MAG TPA: 4-alpha-glucanotransferase [Rhizomicrobium sp.]|nr:4-alpha-glucanotransferase [Rhizomicrobium sp.]
MSDRALTTLARKAGLSPIWTDAHGQRRVVAPDTLKSVLRALGYVTDSNTQVAESLREAGNALPAERTADAPRRAHAMPKHAKFWALAVQIYALASESGIGDFGTLADFAADAAKYGADALAISPVHALFGARPSHISPYSPSTRLFLNPLYIPVASRDRAAKEGPLIDWPRVHAERMRSLRSAFDAFRGDDDFDRFVREGGDHLLGHARFEVLDRRFVAQYIYDWRNWPAQWRDADSRSVQALDAGDPEIRFQLYLQWRADTALGAAQKRARDAGMAIGLIADMAVGVAPNGSLAWSARDEILDGLSIGAPPDIFNPAGQDWGLTTFSPTGLRASGFAGFIATLKAAMRNAGGMRLDHAMGLRRLWVIPRGASAADGVYLEYPLENMLNLIARESLAHNCVVIAEDLGTVPTGFRGTIARHALYGMRVLWFERDGKGNFILPDAWERTAAALSTTHDLPTIAGWWTDRDIYWRRKTGATADATRKAKAMRASDRKKLWRALKQAGCAKGAVPESAGPVIDASIEFLAKTPCPLAIVPAEDLLGLREQPNLPGTIDEHPNWRRRLPDVFASRASRRRATLLTGKREP